MNGQCIIPLSVWYCKVTITLVLDKEFGNHKKESNCKKGFFFLIINLLKQAFVSECVVAGTII